MIVYTDLMDIPSNDRVIVLGNFDGIHLGHQNLIKQGRQIAEKRKVKLSVFTFYPQWQSLNNPEFRYLLTQQDKYQYMENLGVDELFSVECNSDFASIDATKFVEDILIKRMQACCVVVGFNFSFGYKAKGTPELLKNILERHQIEFHVEKAFQYEGNTVSSSLIRRQLKDGNMGMVKELLGYPYHLCGRVIHGSEIGRTINFPTANIEYNDTLLLPTYGVYAAKAWLKQEPNKVYTGVLNIGTRPTVDNNPSITVEMHLFDFKQDIYDCELCIEIHQFLRHISKFKSLDELKLAISLDVENTKKFFK